MHGFHGRILRIDLSERKATDERVPDEVLRQYLGGKGLATYLLLQHLPAGIDPLSPENKLIFATGPAADTTVPAASRYGVFAKSPQTGGFGESYSGGHTAAAMKRTGYDAFMIEGAAREPVYLHISDQGVELGDASDLWGLESYAAEDALLERAGGDDPQALVIGPAGENLVGFACIKNNYWRSAGRTGLGAVMGSKRLKGIVFSGSKKAPLADAQLLQDYVKNLIDTCLDTERTHLLRERGTPWMVTRANVKEAFPTRYWAEGSFDRWEGISSDAMLENMDVKPRACRRCFMACGKLSRVTRGRHKGLVLEGPEYETIYALGGLCCIDEIEEVVYLNDICDRLGLDTITAGNIAGFAIEAGKRGRLSGMPDYGDVDGIARLLENIASKEGPGQILSEGVKKASEELGLEDLAVHVKGLEPAGYDPRTLTGMSLGYAVSVRGACHLRSSFYMAELRGEISREQIEGKAEAFVNYENRNTLEDCLVLCRFYQQFIGWEGMQTIIRATTGLDLSRKEMAALASGVTTLARRFNLREGWTSADDTLPSRLFREPIGQKRELAITEQDLNVMLQEYYRLHNWDEKGIPRDTGIPM